MSSVNNAVFFFFKYLINILFSLELTSLDCEWGWTRRSTTPSVCRWSRSGGEVEEDSEARRAADDVVAAAVGSLHRWFLPFLQIDSGYKKLRPGEKPKKNKTKCWFKFTGGKIN